MHIAQPPELYPKEISDLSTISLFGLATFKNLETKNKNCFANKKLNIQKYLIIKWPIRIYLKRLQKLNHLCQLGKLRANIWKKIHRTERSPNGFIPMHFFVLQYWLPSKVNFASYSEMSEGRIVGFQLIQ